MLRELFRIGEALLVTTGIAGACLGIPIAVFALALKLGTNRNEDRVCDASEGDA